MSRPSAQLGVCLRRHTSSVRRTVGGAAPRPSRLTHRHHHTHHNDSKGSSCVEAPTHALCASRRWLTLHDASDAGPVPSPPPPPQRPPQAAHAPLVEEETVHDPMADLLFQSLSHGGDAETNFWAEVSDAAAARTEGFDPSTSWSALPADSAAMLAAAPEDGPQEVEDALTATLGREQALDYIEAIDDSAEYAALMHGEEGEEGDGQSEASPFWWQHADARANEAPLHIPDAAGHVEGTDSFLEPTVDAARRGRALNGASYLSQMDLLYLSYPAHPDAQLPPPPSTSSSSSSSSSSSPACVLVVYGANDLRVHDHYPLALASARAQTLGLPVVAVCVLDYRTFAQPSLVGGFFRQSPQRAQFLLDTVAALREKLEMNHHVPLLVRCGRPEEHVPRLAVELAAADVYLTTQYAPHERRVHDDIVEAIKAGTWHSRQAVLPYSLVGEGGGDGVEVVPVDEVRTMRGVDAVSEDDTLQLVHAHHVAHLHPSPSSASSPSMCRAATPHSVWQSTLVHLDDLPTPVAAMKEGERWYHDDVTIAAIRPTAPYNAQVARLDTLPCWHTLLPSEDEQRGLVEASVVRGRLPTLAELGYGEVTRAEKALRFFAFEDVIATQAAHPTAGEDAAMAHVHGWLTGNDGSAGTGMTSMLRLGRERRTNTQMYSGKLSRVSPYLAVGALSPRAYYEALRAHTHAHLRDGFVQMQYREALLRLSRRDYWHWMGLRYGDRLFYSYGPRPEDTDGIPDWRFDEKIVQKWCLGLTGLPFADAAMRELRGTGFVASEGRQALQWLLATGLGQDWRLGAEWLERCSLDFDPFVCYGNAAYCAQLIPDDFGEPVRGLHYLAHQHDQTGIYVKKWLPQLAKVPPVYIHRPHVLTPRMQAMHGVYLGKNYPYPIKLWHGAQHSSLRLRGDVLTALYPNGVVQGPGIGEAARHGEALMEPEEWSRAVTHAHMEAIARRRWAQTHLPDGMLAATMETPQLGGRALADEKADADGAPEVSLVHMVDARRRGARTSTHSRMAHVSDV